MSKPDLKPEQQINYTALGHKLGGVCGGDASKWATAFCQHMKKHNFQVDEGLMLGWFANAIECSLDTRPNPINAELVEAIRGLLYWAGSQCPVMSDEEGPDPCPLCSATVEKGACMALEKTIPAKYLDPAELVLKKAEEQL